MGLKRFEKVERSRQTMREKWGEMSQKLKFSGLKKPENDDFRPKSKPKTWIIGSKIGLKGSKS